MNLRTLFQLCGVLFLSATAAHGQIASTLRLSKPQYIAGEAVSATVTITNHSGADLVLQGTTRMPWLDFVIKTNTGEPSIPTRMMDFGSVRIPTGQSMSRVVNLSTMFNLADVGSFSVYGVIRVPGQARNEESTTNRVLFNLTTGRAYWTQKVGVKGNSSAIREYRVLNYAGDQKTQLFVQVVDAKTGAYISTFPLGDALMFRKPQITVDRDQSLHVFFLSSPTMWSHCWVNTSGKLVGSEFHQRGGQGDPQMMTFGDGTVRISNSVLYDPKAVEAARSKARKASERPTIN